MQEICLLNTTECREETKTKQNKSHRDQVISGASHGEHVLEAIRKGLCRACSLHLPSV